MILTVGLWWWNDVFFFFFFCGFDGCGRGDGGCCGYDLVVRCLIFFFFFLWVGGCGGGDCGCYGYGLVVRCLIFFSCGFGGSGGGLVTMMVV